MDEDALLDALSNFVHHEVAHSHCPFTRNCLGFGSNSQKNMKEESAAALETLRAELETQHEAAMNQLKADWSKEKEAEIKLQVDSQVAAEKAAWKEELQQV